MIKLVGVEKTLGGQPVLRGVDLEIPPYRLRYVRQCERDIATTIQVVNIFELDLSEGEWEALPSMSSNGYQVQCADAQDLPVLLHPDDLRLAA